MHTRRFFALFSMSLRYFSASVLVLSWLLCGFAQSLENQLENSPSPYLAAHRNDPVAWQEWNSATLELARKQNKLLFVSIGYFSCHWCHVMQAESYRNPEIAALINDNFIPVKVDRELAVALDAEMTGFARATLGSAGWPLNVFITPEGYPLYASLYEKPERLGVILGSISSEWRADSAGLKAIAQKTKKEAQAPAKKISPTRELALQYRQQLVQEALARADLLSGGMNVQRKFPMSPQLLALLEVEARRHDAKLAEWLRLTLDQMVRGGLRDHVGGGFFRYTTDQQWQRPHFEKMLYDNAQLALVFLRAAKIFRQPQYREVAVETLDFMLAEMRNEGGFITSLSAADADGKEGGSYLWTEEQLESVLDSDELKLLAGIWGMDAAAEFDSGYLPLQRKQPGLEEQRRLKNSYRKLLQLRKQRLTPKDTKMLAGLNGLALSAFSEAAGLAPRFRMAADELRAFILNTLWQNGILYKGRSGQQLLGQGDLESYAYTAAGLMHYARLGGHPAEAKAAQEMAKIAWHKFHTPQGFVLDQQTGLAHPLHQTAIEDGALPSPSSVLIDASLQTGDQALRDLAREALADGDTLRKQGLFWFASQVRALNRMFPAHVQH